MVHIREDRAIVIAPCVITLRFIENDKEYDFTSYVRLLYRAQRLGPMPAWKVLSLGTVYVQDAVVPSSPSPHQSSVINTTFRRQSYKHLCWLLERSGFELSDDLPGADDPLNIDREIAKLFQWLHG